jgi:Tannase and feruloyl esterase
MKKRDILCLLGTLLTSAPLLHAADCAALKNLQLADTTITAAEPTSGDLEAPGGKPSFHELPPFCRVTGIFHPSADSKIQFEIWLPEKDWNQRFLGVGNGGFAGSIGYQGLAGNLRRGFATAGSDAGHQGESEDASWAFGHPEKVKDFGWRAVHLTAERTKEVIAAYYGKKSDKNYFDSCSDGGREALMEAQRFPADYDGILAGAPANAWTRLLSSGLDVAQATNGDPRAYISSMKLPAIERASLAACDESDGVKDGFINNPAQCHFDPAVLLCKAEDSLECLTAPQVASLKKYYAGGEDAHGKSIFRGFSMGDESSWKDWVVGHGPGAGDGIQYAQNYFRYMVTGDPKLNLLTANVDQLWHESEAKTAADVDAVNPDLKPFSARGGKLILYHGWNDPAISPWNSIAYYESVQKATAGANSFLRLYMVPGMEHCAGGPGPASFGQLGIPTTNGPKYGVFDALVNWVEKDVAPTSVITTKYGPGEGAKVVMTRPLCPYPAIAIYNGTGDTNQAANFTCTKQ